MRSGWNLTVVCKATFLLLPGESPLHSPQEPLYEDDRYWEDNRTRSLAVASDMVPYKPRADVVLVGSAYAPGKKAARSIVARLVVGEVDKSLEAFCDRTFTQDGQLREGPWVNNVSLRYEQAAGGPDSWNPVGFRHDAPPDIYGRVSLPNLQPSGLHVSRREDVIAPIGFGPIAPMWPRRRERLGPHAGTWAHDRWWAQPLPSGFEPAFFNVAPRDQQIAELRENERIVLENLHVEQPQLITNLPGMRPRAVVERSNHGREEVPLVCDTLWIDTDRGICTLVWRARVALAHAEESGRVIVSLERVSNSMGVQPRGTPGWRASAGMGGPVVDVTKTVRADFGEGGDEGDVMRTVSGSVTTGQGPVLPFANAPPSSTRVGGGPTSAQGQNLVEASKEGLPFVAPTGPRAPASALFEASAPASTKSAPMPPPMLSRLPMVDPIASPMVTPAEPVLVPLPAEESPWAALRDATGEKGTVGQVAAQAGRLDALMPPKNSTPTVETPKQTLSAEVIELIGCDPDAMLQVRSRPSWKKIIADARPRPASREPDEELPPERRQEHRNRRDIIAVLARDAPLNEVERCKEVLDGAVGDDGVFTPPLALLSGEIELGFDELETLKATVAAVSPFVGGDKKLKEAVDNALELIKSPYAQSAIGQLEGMAVQIREVFMNGSSNRTLRYLEAHVERALLRERHYQKRRLLKKTWIRGTFTAGAQPVPAYLPDSLTEDLPLFRRFKVRLIAELHFQLDQFEANPMALQVVAIARLLPRWRGR